VFGSLIGGPGLFAITPEGADYVWGGYYEDASLIWRSRWVTTAGIIECREALAMPARTDSLVLIRQVQLLEGAGEATVTADIRPGFGSEKVALSNAGNGAWEATTARGLHIRLSGLRSARPIDGALVDRLTLRRGEPVDIVLELSTAGLVEHLPKARELWTRTEQAWRSAIPTLADTAAPRDARQSLAVLRGLTSASGGMVAAATLGLPERSESNRSYDYRYAWIRDQCFAGEAAATVSAQDLVTSAVSFVSERINEDGAKLRPAYTVTGGPLPEEMDLDLTGYPGGTPRTGNHAGTQFQLDAFGESLLLFAAADRAGLMTDDARRAAATALSAIESRWQEPDAGIWELENKLWTHSRLVSGAGIRAVSGTLGRGDRSRWDDLAGRILSDATRNNLHSSGRWMRAADDERIDASLLLAEIRGAVGPEDHRSVATLESVRAELTREGYVYRYRSDPDRPLEDAEGAFLLCGFYTALAEHMHGREREAVALFERNRSATGSPGLFTEEFDVSQRQLRGNFPQAFVHAALLETAARLNQGPANHNIE
jgi:GH15 family glucan-1,4-alpha-glucosidase